MNAAQEGANGSSKLMKKSKASPARFFSVRRHVYGALLVFIVLAGASLFSLPAMRHRLYERVHALKAALSGETRPVMVLAGENREKLPAEYEELRPLVPGQAPRQPGLQVLSAESSVADAGFKKSSPRKIKIPQVVSSPVQPEDTEEIDDTDHGPQEGGATLLPVYRQGVIEKEVYELLLNSSPTVTALVQGNDPSLKFLTWDAANRGEDIYWLRLKFESKDKSVIEYIWQIHLQSRKITPLNYNARSL